MESSKVTVSPSWWMSQISENFTPHFAASSNTWCDSITVRPAQDYDWPASPPPRCAPYNHQIATVNYSLHHRRFFNFSEIGMGKTLTTVWALHLLMRLGLLKRVLVVAPKSTTEIVWRRTLQAVDFKIWSHVLQEDAATRTEAFKDSCARPLAATVINPDGLHILADNVTPKFLKQYDLIVVDETALFRNRTARRYKALAKLASHIPGLWGLSGAPMPEGPLDIYPMASLIAPQSMPSTFSAFREMTTFKVDTYKRLPRPGAIEFVAGLLKNHSVRYVRSECLDLPRTLTITHDIELTPDQKKLATLLKQDMIVRMENGEINAANEAVLRGKLLQVFAGCVKLSDGSTMDVDASTKYEALELVLIESSGPVIVYTPYIGSLLQISKWLDKLGVVHATVNGGTRASDRVAAFDAVQANKVRVLLAHPKAMAHGLTLTRSNVIVWWTPYDSGDVTTQANGRITRPGQERETLIIHFAASSLERKVIRKLETNESLQGTLLDYLKCDPTI